MTTRHDGFVDGPLLRTVTDHATDIWNDSCAIVELGWAISRGATGATSNPSIVLEVLRKERTFWAPRVLALSAAHPTCSETDLTWAVVEETAIRGAAVLEPVFRRESGRKGRLSLQTDPTDYASTADARTGPASHRARPEHAGQFPATKAGIEAVEQATAAGVHINATVCFTVPQAIAVAGRWSVGWRRSRPTAVTPQPSPRMHDHGRPARRLDARPC